MDDDKLTVIPGGKGKQPETKGGVLQLSERGREMLPDKPLNKRELERFTERAARKYIPEAVVTFWEAVIEKAKRGDTLAMQMLGKATKILEDKPAVAVQVNTTVNTGRGKTGRSMEALLRDQQSQRLQIGKGGRETVIDTSAV